MSWGSVLYHCVLLPPAAVALHLPRIRQQVRPIRQQVRPTRQQVQLTGQCVIDLVAAVVIAILACMNDPSLLEDCLGGYLFSFGVFS